MATQLSANADAFKPSPYAPAFTPTSDVSRPKLLKLNSNAKPFVPNFGAKPFTPKYTQQNNYKPTPQLTHQSPQLVQQQQSYTQVNYGYEATRAAQNGVRQTFPTFRPAAINSVPPQTLPSLAPLSIPSPSRATQVRPSSTRLSRTTSNLNHDIPEFVPRSTSIQMSSPRLDQNISQKSEPVKLAIAQKEAMHSKDQVVKVHTEDQIVKSYTEDQDVQMESEQQEDVKMQTEEDSLLNMNVVEKEREIKPVVRSVKKADVRQVRRNTIRDIEISREDPRPKEIEKKETEFAKPATRVRPLCSWSRSKPKSLLGLNLSRRPAASPLTPIVSASSHVTPTFKEKIIESPDELSDEEIDIASPITRSKRAKKKKAKLNEDVEMSDVSASKGRVYTIAFMMQLESLPQCQIRPVDMPDIEKDLIGNGQSRANFSGGRNRKSFQMGGGRNRQNPRNQGYGRNRNTTRNKRDDNMKVEPLKKSANAYKPTRKEDLDGHALVIRDINSILNKLTPEKFETLTKRFLEDIPIKDLQTLKDVVNCVFEKALAEAPFCPTYAKFCYTVSSRKTLDDDDEKFKENGQVQTFKRLLLNQCQKEFGKHDSYQGDTKINDEARVVQKKRLLGTIRFVGDLYINKMATGRIIKECLNTLLGDIPNEQDIEVCCQLLETCGKHIDGSDPNLLPRYFSTLKLWSSSGDLGICTRIRFKMKDIIELRQKKWKARIEKVKAVKIGEIHKQDQKDKQRAKMASNQNKNRRTNRGMPRNQIGDRYSQKPRKAKRDDYNDNSWSSASARKKQYPDRTRGRTEDSRRNYQKKQDISQKRSKKNEDLTPNRVSMFEMLNDEEEMLPVRGGRQSRQSQSRQGGRFSSAGRDTGRDQSRDAMSPRNPPSRDSGKQMQSKPQIRLIKPISISNENPSDKRKVDTDSTNLFQELFTCYDVENAELCVDELIGNGQYNYLVFTNGVKQAADDVRPKSTDLVIKLLKQLKSTRKITPPMVTRGLDVLLKDIRDLAMDAPKIWQIGGEILAAMIFADMASLTHFTTVKSQELKQVSKLVAYTLQFLMKRDASKTRSLFEQSGISLASLCSGRQTVADLVDRYNLKDLQ